MTMTGTHTGSGPARLAAILLSLVLCGAAQGAEPERTAGPYVPTPQIIVDRMLRFAQVSPKDYVIDLGSGDGRIVITAAKLGATGFGVDIDPELVMLSNSNAKRDGVAGRAVFYERDVFKADIGKASVLTLYVLPGMMVNLRPKVLAELRPGTRIVSHDYHFADWLPDMRENFDAPEKQAAVGFSHVSLYLWIVPAHAAGSWRIEVAGAEAGSAPYTLDLRQSFQKLRGTVTSGKRVFELMDIDLRGDQVRFGIPSGAEKTSPRHRFRGRVQGTTMQGEVELAGDKGRQAWRATRIAAPAEPLAQ